MIPGPFISAMTVSSPIGRRILPLPFLCGPSALSSMHALPFSPVGFSGDTALDRSPLKVVILFNKFIILTPFLFVVWVN